MLLRETFPVGHLGCNCTVVACADSKDALVIDPGGDPGQIAEVIKQYDLTVRAIVHTHGHVDHVFSTRDVKEAHGGELCMSRGDVFLYEGLVEQAAMFGFRAKPVLPIDRFIQDGDEIEFGRRRLVVIATPGHTPGSVCLELCDEDERRAILFSGDTLFRRGIGRTDLRGGDYQQIVRSIRERIYSRDPRTLVVPGHGPTTTIGEEARENPHVTA